MKSLPLHLVQKLTLLLCILFNDVAVRAQLHEEPQPLKANVALTLKDSSLFDTKDGLLDLYNRFTGSTTKKADLMDKAIIMVFPEFKFDAGSSNPRFDNLIKKIEDELIDLLKDSVDFTDMNACNQLLTVFNGSETVDLTVIDLINSQASVRTSNTQPLRAELITRVQTLRNNMITHQGKKSKPGSIGITPTSTVSVKVLSTVGKKDGSFTWTETLVEPDEVEVVTFYPRGKSMKLDIKYEELRNHFNHQLADLLKLAREIGAMSFKIENTTDLPLTAPIEGKRLILNPSYLRAPYNLHLIYKSGLTEPNDTTKITVDERYHLSLNVGLSSSLLNRSQIDFTGNDITISADSATAEEWKENLMVGLTFSLGARTSKYDPKLFKYYGQPENNFWKRTSLLLGCNLSARPLDNVYLGVAHDLSKNLTLMGGISRPRNLADQTVTIADGDNLNKTLRNAARTPGDITFFWGIAFSPGELLELIKDK